MKITVILKDFSNQVLSPCNKYGKDFAKMIDEAKIYVKAGDGGGGSNSFKGAKFTRSQHPDGGSGGRGADVIIRVDPNIQSLEHFQFKQHFRAENGKCGLPNKKRGAQGRPCIIRVPPGTVVYDLKNNLFLRDLLEPDEELIVAKGGEGGKANTGKDPATAGLVGEERQLFLELKLVADIGIVGYPNAGKSTLLSKITAARPKIANFAFTTVSPFLGVIEFQDFIEPTRLTLVEVPALIKGAHKGKGLGVQFLRHAQRCKILIHLIDMAGQQGQTPLENYYNLNQELKIYDLQLIKKLQVLVANKMDLKEAQSNLENFSLKVKKKIFPISALTGDGVKELLNHLRNYFQN